MLHLSMNELSTLRWSFEEDVVEYAQAGFQGIGVWRQKLTDVGEDAAADLLRRHGLTCSNLLWAGGFTGSDGCSFRDSVLDAVEAIQQAARLGCRCLVIYSGSWGGHTRKHARRLVRNALEQIIPFAEEFGVDLAIEPMHPGCGGDWTFLETIKETLSLVNPLESPCVRLTLDTYQFGVSEQSLSMVRDIAHRVAIVHLGDAHHVPQGEQDRCPLGNGMIPNEQIIQTLLECGYEGYFDVELIGESMEDVDYPTMLSQAHRYLTSLLAAR